MNAPRICYNCRGSLSKGYGVTYRGKSQRRRYVCYDCGAAKELERMNKEGVTTLYLSYRSPCSNAQFTSRGVNLTPSDYTVTNWSGALSFVPISVRVGRHNVARRRWDVWFVVERQIGRGELRRCQREVWHGVRVGDNTELLHCKRTQHKAV